MASLKSLVETYGFGITVKSVGRGQNVEFHILKEGNDPLNYKVVFSDGVILEYRKQMNETDDYELVSK